MTTYILIVHVC